MRAWHVWGTLGVVVTVTCVVQLREQNVQVKGDFFGVTAGVGDARGLPIRFDDRWDEVSDIAPPSPPRAPPPAITQAAPVPDTASPSPLPAPPPAMTQTASVPQHHPGAQRELCAAHGMRREYYRRGGWLYWRCK